jgi:hypothetical protein
MSLNRRALLRGGMSLGALTLLTGCDLSDNDAVQGILARFSAWNDRVQAALFNPNRLAPTFPESEAVKDFRYNAWYGRENAPALDAASYRLSLAGLIANKKPWTVDQLYALPQISQVTRHVCVEGWSMIGKWTGTPLRTFFERIGRSWRSSCPTRSCHGNTAIRSRSACRPNWGSRTRNSSRRCSSPTCVHTGSGPIAATTGSAGSEPCSAGGKHQGSDQGNRQWNGRKMGQGAVQSG